MILDWLLALKENVDRHGIRFGLIITLYAMYRKERRNFRLDKRDEAIFHNQRVIMEHLGVKDQWHGQVKILNEDLVNLKRWLQLSCKVIRLALIPKREKNTKLNGRRKKMLTNLLSGKKKLLTFVLLVVLNGLNDTLGLNLSHETIVNISSLGGGYIVVEAILDIVRAFVNGKGGKNNDTTKYPGDTGAAV